MFDVSLVDEGIVVRTESKNKIIHLVVVSMTQVKGLNRK